MLNSYQTDSNRVKKPRELTSSATVMKRLKPFEENFNALPAKSALRRLYSSINGKTVFSEGAFTYKYIENYRASI